MTPRLRAPRGLSKAPPPPESLKRLERMPGSARQWRDPLTGVRYSNRKRQEALHGNISIERWAKLRQDNPDAAQSIERSERKYQQGEHRRDYGPASYYINYGHLARRYENLHDMEPGEAYDSPNYWRAVDNVVSLVSGTATWAELADDFADDFGAYNRDELFDSGGESE